MYLGSTFVRHSSGTVALAAGGLGICAAIVALLGVIRQRKNPWLFLIEMCFLILLCLATAAATSSGRIHLGVEQATASRYQTFALVFWCCLGLIVLVQVARNQARFQGFAAALLIMMLGFATQVRLPLIDAQWHQLRLKMVGLSLLTGVQDDAVLAEAYPDPQVVLRAAQYMKQQRLSIFAGKQYEQLGTMLDNDYAVSSAGGCSGFVSSTQILPSDDGHGLRLTGYAWDNERRLPPRDIVAVVDGHVAGFGSNVAITLTSKGAGPQSDPSKFGWVTFVRNNGSRVKVQLFAVTRNGAVCPFAETAP